MDSLGRINIRRSKKNLQNQPRSGGMYIQYRGFNVAMNSRIYKFQVLDPAREQRAFTVQIQSDTNHWHSLKLQDGPGICFERLEQELGRETPAKGVEQNLQISEVDILAYLKRHYPPVKTYGPKTLPELSAESLPARASETFAHAAREIASFRVGPLKKDAQVSAILLYRSGEARDLLKVALESHLIQIHCLTSVQEALPLLRDANPPHLVFTEDTLPDGTWAEVVKRAMMACKPVKVIVVSRVVDVSLYVEAMDGGAYDFIVPPLSAVKVDYVVERAMETVLNLRRDLPVAV
jgi:CheY-like chemotaxis protein